MSTSNNTIASVIASLYALDAAILQVKSFGIPIDVMIVPANGAATTVEQFNAPAVQTAVAASSPVASVAVSSAPVAATEVAAPVTIQSPEERVASLVGTTIKTKFLGVSRRGNGRGNSTGYKLDSEGSTPMVVGAAGSDRERTPVGYINVYKNSIGKDVHKTVAKAVEYASDSVLTQLPVYAA